jgi:hypothetical protein
MKLKIYQPFFTDDQQSLVDPDFVPMDLRTQSEEEALLREHTIHLRCRELAIDQGLDVWGMFSWKWRQKMAAYTKHEITGQDIIQQVQDNPGYDVYFFNAYSQSLNYAYNVWEHGSWCHEHILEICEELFPMLDLDYRLLYAPMGLEVTCYANYYLGNKLFWDEWLDLILRYRAAIPKLSSRIQALHNGSAGYHPPFENLWHFPFIHERLFSTWLLKNYDRYAIYSCHYIQPDPHANLLSSELHTLDSINVDACKQYLERRKFYPHPYTTKYHNVADAWIKEIIEPMQKNKDSHATNT